MPTEIINALKDGKIHSLQELADMLKTDVPLVKAQLEYLEKLGYIKKVAPDTGCSQSCRCCKGCGQSAPVLPAMWALTK